MRTEKSNYEKAIKESLKKNDAESAVTDFIFALFDTPPRSQSDDYNPLSLKGTGICYSPHREEVPQENNNPEMSEESDNEDTSFMEMLITAIVLFIAFCLTMTYFHVEVFLDFVNNWNTERNTTLPKLNGTKKCNSKKWEI